MQDELLVRRLQQGDRAAFDELYTKYRDEALRTACLITGSRPDGEDVVQETFIQCYQMICQLRDPSRFKYWLFRSLTRTAWKYCQRHRKEEPVAQFFDDALTASESALSSVLRSEEHHQLYEAVQALEPKQRMVVILYYFNDMAVKDIAQTMNCREGTVKSRLFTARHNLQKTLRCDTPKEVQL